MRFMDHVLDHVLDHMTIGLVIMALQLLKQIFPRNNSIIYWCI